MMVSNFSYLVHALISPFGKHLFKSFAHLLNVRIFVVLLLDRKSPLCYKF